MSGYAVQRWQHRQFRHLHFTSIIGCFLVAAGMEGWVVRPLIKWKRILAVAGGLCCIIPEHITDLIGVAVLVFLVVSECRAKKLEQTAVS